MSSIATTSSFRTVSRWGWVVKLILSTGMLWFVIRTTGASLSQLRVSAPGMMVLAILVFAIQPLVDVPRWALILRMLGCAIPLRRVLAYFYVGLLFNQILPASISGDAMRVIYLRTQTVPWLKNILSVALDRMVALCGLCILYVTLFGLASGQITGHFDARVVYSASIAAIVLTLIAAAFCAKWLPAYANTPQAFAGPGRDPYPTPGTFDAIAAPWKALPVLTGLGVMVHLIGAVGFVLVLKSIGYSMPFPDVMIVSALVTIAQSLPISIGGWGARELAAVALLQRVGIEANDAFFASIILGLTALLASLPGIYFWLVTPIELQAKHAATGGSARLDESAGAAPPGALLKPAHPSTPSSLYKAT